MKLTCKRVFPTHLPYPSDQIPYQNGSNFNLTLSYKNTSPTCSSIDASNCSVFQGVSLSWTPPITPIVTRARAPTCLLLVLNTTWTSSSTRWSMKVPSNSTTCILGVWCKPLSRARTGNKWRQHKGQKMNLLINLLPFLIQIRNSGSSTTVYSSAQFHLTFLFPRQS